VRPKDKGTYAESLLVKHLVGSGVFPGAHRSALSGSNDIGDVIGCRDFTIQVKSCKTMQVPAWLRDTEEQRVRGQEKFGVLVVKRIGSGAGSVGNWHVVMLGEPWKHLWREAGKPVINMWFAGKNTTDALTWIGLGLDVIRVEFRSGITVADNSQFRVMTVDGWLNLARRRTGTPESAPGTYLDNPQFPFLREVAA
jgi:hypothetical protein